MQGTIGCIRLVGYTRAAAKSVANCNDREWEMILIKSILEGEQLQEQRRECSLRESRGPDKIEQFWLASRVSSDSSTCVSRRPISIAPDCPRGVGEDRRLALGRKVTWRLRHRRGVHSQAPGVSFPSLRVSRSSRTHHRPGFPSLRLYNTLALDTHAAILLDSGHRSMLAWYFMFSICFRSASLSMLASTLGSMVTAAPP